MATPAPTEHLDLTFVVPTLDERSNVEALLPQLCRVAGDLRISSETLVVDGPSRDGTREAARALGAVVLEVEPGYGNAIRAGLLRAHGEYVITMDADLSHGPEIVSLLWEARDARAIGIASRYVRGGSARTHIVRRVLSRILNVAYGRGLSLPVRDLSSGFRIYPAAATRELVAEAAQFDILPELLVRAYSAGWRVTEIPFDYRPRQSGHSKARIARLGLAYLRTFAKLWRLRNSIGSADYDERAFDSIIPLQRYWQRRRHAIVLAAAAGRGRILDVGCGSSRILRDLGRDAVGLDIGFERLRYMSRYGTTLAQGSIFALPFRDGSFDTVVCSEVIEHVAGEGVLFEELARVNRRGGRLVLGTPDYGRFSWRALEAVYRRIAPGGYADEHITHYTHDRLRDTVVAVGYRYLRTDYVLGSEMILTFERI